MNIIQIHKAPEIPGLRFRHFRGEKDYPAILQIINACRQEDKLDWTETIEDIKKEYAHLDNCDPYKDMLFVEINDHPIGYGRIFWYEEYSKDHMYFQFFWLTPAWRGKGIGKAVLQFLESRIKEIALDHPADIPKYFRGWSSETRRYYNNLLESFDYEIVRYGYEMTRPIEASLPQAPLPHGLEVRPVRPEHYDAIWDARNEAFRDHWGWSPPTENERQHWEEHKTFQPDLWEVAWDDDEVAGMALNFIDESENRAYDRLRGYTEDICVLRPRRRKGLARALLVRSIKMFREMELEETCLGVDTENVSGALGLYESVGYKPHKVFYRYSKPLVIRQPA